MEKETEKELYYCRKCMKFLPERETYKAVDGGLIDTNGRLSVCKNCAQEIYDKIFSETNSFEKTIHKMCTSLNIKYSNEAASATKKHVETLVSKGNNVNAIFSIFLMKLVATNPSMNKSAIVDMTYDDVGTIFTTEKADIKEIPIPEDVIQFWGKDVSKQDIEFLETQYANFKATHKADTYAEIVLLKQVCYTILDIKKLRIAGDDTGKLVKELQDLMKNLAISPHASTANTSTKGEEAFGLWIQDIEKEEPAQWLKRDPRGDMYRDVGDVEEYFQKYIVRPIKNFITGSKDFNTGDEDETDDDFYLEIDGEEENKS